MTKTLNKCTYGMAIAVYTVYVHAGNIAVYYVSGDTSYYHVSVCAREWWSSEEVWDGNFFTPDNLLEDVVRVERSHTLS